ncbi:MAG: hypothetical protein GY928_29020 [Colwellia sp.]|nr:hypothetical protein [Colwellia sp.]
MYKLEQEVYFDDRKCTVVRKIEAVGEETVYTLKDGEALFPTKESRLSLTPPNAFTYEEFMKVFDTSAFGRSDYTLRMLHEFVEECFRSKKCIN